MPEPAVAQDLLDFARRWAVGLQYAESGSAEFEAMVVQLAREIQNEGERVVRGADARFVAFYQHCPAPVVLTDATGTVSAANPAFLRMVGVPSDDELRGGHVANLGAAVRDQDALRDALTELTAAPGGRVRDQIEVGVAEDRTRFVRLSAATLPGDDGVHPIFMFEDMHELQLLQETFQYQGLHDRLTGLPNAAHFRSQLETMIINGAQDQVAVLFLDVDGFKVVNEGLGPDAADHVLRGIVRTLRLVFADRQAFIARLFGDMFAVALHGELTPTSVVHLAEQTIDELAKPVYVDEDIGVGVSVSVGIVLADLPDAEHVEMMRSAEVALHRAKDLGKAQWVLFDPVSGKAERDRCRLASAIAGALEFGEMTVTYQPHVVLPDAQIVTSLNATLRWNHPTLGEFRSEKFYSLAETTGMTVPLGRHLLSQALDTTAYWRAQFGSDSPMVCLTLPQRMAIDGDLVGIVRAELDRNELEPRHLMLCTDAPSLLDRRGDVLESIGHLAGLGVLFILDVSGLPELELVPALQVPVPAVMLVGSIVDALATDDPPEWAERNVRQLGERAEELGIKVGAHGVRSQAHAQRLFDLGVVVGSGTYLPEYLTRAEAEVWVGRVFPMG